MRLLAGILIGAALAGFSAGTPAIAAEDPESLIREGVTLRRQGHDARAEGYFRRAYQLATTPRTAAQLGLVELALGEFAEADARLTEALSNRDAWVSEHQKEIEGGRATARQHLLRVEMASAPPGATYASDRASPVAIPPNGVVWLPPGATTLRIEAPGRRSIEVHAEGRAGEVRQITLELPAREEPAKVVTQVAPVVRQPPPAVATEAGGQPPPIAKPVAP